MTTSDADDALTDSILAGLRATPRTLPCALLYDALGSTLFEAITRLPEYEVTRADVRLLDAHTDHALDALAAPVEVVELGPGAGLKALRVLGAVAARQAHTVFTAVDISREALVGCARTLEALPTVETRCVEATYLDGLARAPRVDRTKRLVLFLGSNLSNFDRDEAPRFLADVRARLAPGDALLLATDIGYDPARLVPAYDDALGVTAAFNRNVLLRLNRSWGADFDLGAFAHQARWNAPARRIEMHLVATRATVARLRGERFAFAPGDTIWTESSHRFALDELRDWSRAAGYDCAHQWTDAAWPFAHSLLVAR